MGVQTNLLGAALIACGVAGSLAFAFPIERISGSFNEVSVVVLSIVAQSSKHLD